MSITFEVIEIVVADMARSLAFYRGLGLDIPAEADGEGHVDLALPGGLRMSWDAAEIIRSFDPSWAPGSGGPRMSIAFRCASPGEVDSTYADLVAAGNEGHREPWDAPWGMRYAVLHDPDGNGVDLFADLAAG
jgi:catechol 2,3-dioxygenase-like lactoylglutathione lyase family enzyme